MPVYTYRCKSCDHEFTDVLTISKMNEPLESPCPECSEGELRHVIAAAVIGYNNTSFMKPTGEFQDRLKDMKKMHAKENTIGDAIRS